MAIGDRGSIDLAVGAIAISGGIHINVSMSRDNFVRHRRVWMGMVWDGMVWDGIIPGVSKEEVIFAIPGDYFYQSLTVLTVVGFTGPRKLVFSSLGGWVISTQNFSLHIF